MARKHLPIGPNTHSLVEDAPSDLLIAVLMLRDSNEPDFALPEIAPDQEEKIWRQSIVAALAALDQDNLQPLEIRCRRIKTLGDGKGVASLNTIASDQLDESSYATFESQPDYLCRSIWTYVQFKNVFEDAESFHFTRQYRDHGKLYDAFEVELEHALTIDASSIDEKALAEKITTELDLKTPCTVKVMDLPQTDEHPPSIMIIVRHGGPLSSVYHHADDGRREPLYFRPSNEATLIYTPSLRQIEVCANSPFVRQKISSSFAALSLGHDVSNKPLTWKHYNLSRFRESLSLPIPEIEGFDIQRAQVLEAEVRLGSWARKLSLKVSIEDDIDDIATRYLQPSNIFRRAEVFSRIGIAVVYTKAGDKKERTLNITVSGTKACNLQSKKDPEERSLGYKLLGVWQILSTLRAIEGGDLHRLFPTLIKLYDRPDDEVSGAYLREFGLDPKSLIEGGLLERRGRQDIVFLDDDEGGEARVGSSSTPGMIEATGAFGEQLGERPAWELEVFRIKREWLDETVLRLMKPLLKTVAVQFLDQNLTMLGSMNLGDAEAPIFLARRLDDPRVLGRLDLLLRGRNNSGIGLVLSASPQPPGCLGPNAVVPILSHLSGSADECRLSRDSLEIAFRSGKGLALGGLTVNIARSGPQSATLYVPGQAPLALLGANQIRIFAHLVDAYRAGSPDVKVSDLINDLGVKSPAQAFRPENWAAIRDVYIGKGAKRGFWRLLA